MIKDLRELQEVVQILLAKTSGIEVKKDFVQGQIAFIPSM